MQGILKVIEIISYSLIPLSLLESLYLYMKGKVDLKESIANLSSNILGRGVKIFISSGFLLFVLNLTSKVAFFKIPLNVWTIVGTVFLTDFIYYWKHRLSHEIRLLWAFHSVHHSSYQYNLTTALRLPWFGYFLDSLFYVPFVLIGFDPLALVMGKAIVLIAQYPIHTQSIGKFPLLDKFLNTPSNHRVHHGVNPQYIDKNHGGVLMIWDRTFGTYQKEVEPVKYGLTTPIESYNPFIIQFFETWTMIKQVYHAKGFKNKLGYIFGNPGWSPGATREDKISDMHQNALKQKIPIF